MSSLIVAHGDLDGITSAALLAEQLGMNTEDVNMVFTQPFLVDKVVIPEEIENVYIVDIAINNRDPDMTLKFISKLGQKLIRWYDHHQGWENLKFPHTEIWRDQDGKLNRVEHTTFEGGVIWYNNLPACADIFVSNSKQQIISDAIAADTREGELSPTGQLIDRAVKSDMDNDQIKMWAVKLLMGDVTYRNPLKAAERAYQLVENETYRLSSMYIVDGVEYTKTPDETYGESTRLGRDYKGKIAFVDATGSNHTYDLTQLLLKGQELATFAVAKTVNPISKEKMITVATKSKTDLVELFELPSGATFRVSIPASRLAEVIEKIGVV